MRVTVMGAGYVGLVSACFADFGHQVTCIDKDVKKIAAAQPWRNPHFEPGLAGPRAKFSELLTSLFGTVCFRRALALSDCGFTKPESTAFPDPVLARHSR
jgi:UDP-glucose 6-dehydrogenase